MRTTKAVMFGALAAWLLLTALSSGSPRINEDATVFKGPMDPSGKIRFQLIEAKRDGAAPKLDHFHFEFDCNDGLGPAGQNYGVLSGDSLRPNEFGKFRIRAAYPGVLLAVRGDFNRRFTKATGLMRFKGDIGDGEHTDCDTGPLEWKATPQP